MVQARIDLAAPTHTARLGVRDRRPPERDGEPVVPIHPAHLGQGVRLDVTLLDPVPLLEHKDLQPSPGALPSGDRPAGTRPDHDDVVAHEATTTS